MSEPCPAPAQLEQLLTGRDDLMEAALEHHLEQCPRCQQKLEQLTASASSLGRRFRPAALVTCGGGSLRPPAQGGDAAIVGLGRARAEHHSPGPVGPGRHGDGPPYLNRFPGGGPPPVPAARAAATGGSDSNPCYPLSG